MTGLDPQKFREQFAEAVVQGATQQMLVISCHEHGQVMFQPKENSPLICPIDDCPVRVSVAIEERPLTQ